MSIHVNKFTNWIILIGISATISISMCNAQDIIDQSVDDRPDWLNEPPDGNYFRYFSGTGTSNTNLSEAKEQAISDVLSTIIMERGVIAESEIKTFQEQNGEEIISVVSREIKQKGISTSITNLQKEEEYWEVFDTGSKLYYRYWILMRYPKPDYKNVNFDALDLNPTYGITPVLKSLVVPGWGQMHKGETTKGIWILAGFTVALTSGIITSDLSSNFETDAQNATGEEWIDYYNNLSEQYYIASIISFAIAGAIYGFNIYDAISSDGVKIYAKSIDIQPGIVYVNRSRLHTIFKLQITL